MSESHSDPKAVSAPQSESSVWGDRHIGTVIACRLKSTRLKRKALLKIGSLTSVELCIKHCLNFQGVRTTILATSTEAEDQELRGYTYRPEVKFFTGDPDDMIQRFVDAADAYGLDVVVRVTADMPYVSDEILQVMLRSHFETGADYTYMRAAALGTNLEIYEASALRRCRALFPPSIYSEYLSYYFRNNPSVFKLNYIDLPQHLIRDYRLTLDYAEDLAMFEKIEAHFAETGHNFSLPALFAFLDSHPEVADMNRNLLVKYVDDKDLVARITEVTTLPVQHPPL